MMGRVIKVLPSKPLFLSGIPFGRVKEVAAFHLYRDAAVRFRTISTR